MLSCARRFDRGIQGQDVGLKRNRINHANDLTHPFGLGMDVVHGRHHLVHQGTAGQGCLSGLVCQGVGLIRSFIGTTDRLGQQRHGRIGLLQMSRRGLRAVGQVLVARGDFCRGNGNGFGRVLNILHQPGQGTLHAVQRAHQL